MELSKPVRFYTGCPDHSTSDSVDSCPRSQTLRSSKMNEPKPERALHEAAQGTDSNWDDGCGTVSLARAGSACSSNFRDETYDVTAREDRLFKKLQNLKSLYLADLWNILGRFKKRLRECRHDRAASCVIKCHVDILERMIVLMVVQRDNLPSWLVEETVSKLKHQSLQYLKNLKDDKFDAGFENAVARHLRTRCSH